jgi:hypothetical protein
MRHKIRKMCGIYEYSKEKFSSLTQSMSVINQINVYWQVVFFWLSVVFFFLIRIEQCMKTTNCSFFNNLTTKIENSFSKFKDKVIFDVNNNEEL